MTSGPEPDEDHDTEEQDQKDDLDCQTVFLQTFTKYRFRTCFSGLNCNGLNYNGLKGKMQGHLSMFLSGREALRDEVGFQELFDERLCRFSVRRVFGDHDRIPYTPPKLLLDNFPSLW